MGVRTKRLLCAAALLSGCANAEQLGGLVDGGVNVPDAIVQGDGCTAQELYPDTDGDGFGDADAQPASLCLTDGFVDNNDDCDDDDLDAFPGQPDTPDDLFVDSNCDGLDGDVDRLVFVATDGDDTGLGTSAQPLLTLQAAIDMAAADPMIDGVAIAAGTYLGNVTLADGVSLYGAYADDGSWTRASTNAAIVRGDTVNDARIVAVTAQGLAAATVVDHIRVETTDAPGGFGVSLYGIYADASPGLSLRHVIIETGTAGSGASGANGSSGLVGSPGGNGGNGSCDGSSYGLGGGGGGSSCGYPGASGGRGGTEGSNDGLAGSNALGYTVGSFGSGGFGGNGDSNGDNGGVGRAGINGASATNGTAGSGGGIVGGFFVGGSGGGGGQNATAGRGGGGGGGGGGQGGLFVNDGSGNGGGGGGGGCPGTAASGGSAGGAAIAILLHDSGGVSLENVTANAGRGGLGGMGGTGGAGGVGGNGGLGAGYCSSEIGDGGNGGKGGNGGRGGHGGGGAGGASYGLYCHNSAPVLVDAPTLTAVGGGTGGNSAGQSGQTGPTAPSLGCP